MPFAEEMISLRFSVLVAPTMTCLPSVATDPAPKYPLGRSKRSQVSPSVERQACARHWPVVQW